MLNVADVASLDEANPQLHIERTISLSGNEQAWPKEVRFSLPASARFELDETYSSEPVGEQRDIVVRLSKDRSRDQLLLITVTMPAQREQANWTLGSRFLFHQVRQYEFRLDFGRSIDRESWRPSRFLEPTVLNEQARNAVLKQSIPETSPYVADISASFRLSDPGCSQAEIVNMLEEMSVLKSLSEKGDSIFKGHRMIILLHFLEDLLPFLYSLEARGLDPRQTLLLHKDYPYAQFKRVDATVRSRGYRVVGPIGDRNDTVLVGAVSNFCEHSSGPILAIEGGRRLRPSRFS